MRAENEARQRKVERISGGLRMVCKVVLAFWGVVAALMLWTFLVGRGPEFTGYNHVSFYTGELTVGGRLIVGGLCLATVGVAIKAVWHLHQLLGDCSRGEIFTQDAARQIRQWGIACMLWGGVKFAWVMLPRVASGVHLQRGQGEFGVGLMVNGLIIVAISWFMEMAAEMREEQELIV
ncbi:MAG TPA: DUF2975 domain-containing protein [Acidobacteriaceae bacterium]|jgi:hypothetical protein|nr:DUF2975 domain-containing protein [Acidobacteriaceae bacterium]